MKKRAIFILTCLLSSGVMFGQGYYDDDIYYNASKAKAEKKAEQKKSAVSYESGDFEAPVYQVYNNSNRDVDEYNRRGGVYSDTLSNDTTANSPDVFEYTERIERFDNPDIIKSSNDEALKELYYANDVNIYIGTPSTVVSFDVLDPWYSGWGYSSWAWGYYPYRYGYYGWNSWYSPYYSPYYCGWYDPFWGPGYWNYPYHYPHSHYAWGGSRPATRYSGTGRRPFGGNPGATVATHNGGRLPNGVRYNSNRATGRRPSASSYSRPDNNRYVNPSSGRTYNGYRGSSNRNNSYRNNNDADRFNYNSFNNNNSNRNSNSYRNNNSRSTYNTPNYNRGNSGSGYRGGSSSGGGRGSFGGGGGRSSGGRR